MTSSGQENGRKRLAKLLGVAPFRLDLVFDGKKLIAEIDGAPLSAEQMKTFQEDVKRLTRQAKGWMN